MSEKEIVLTKTTMVEEVNPMNVKFFYGFILHFKLSKCKLKIWLY